MVRRSIPRYQVLLEMHLAANDIDNAPIGRFLFEMHLAANNIDNGLGGIELRGITIRG